MFFPIRSDTGAVLPFEQHPATAGSYSSGMMLVIEDDGLLNRCNGGVPQFMSVSNATVNSAGELLTVVPVGTGTVYRCDSVDLDADQETFVGARASIDDGIVLRGDGQSGDFLITAILEDGSVEGRFIM